MRYPIKPQEDFKQSLTEDGSKGETCREKALTEQLFAHIFRRIRVPYTYSEFIFPTSLQNIKPFATSAV